MSVTGAIDPTRRIIRQDPLEEFARALGCRVDELLLAGKPSHRHLLAMEFDLEEVTTVITARRPPLEESILRAQRAATVPLSVLGMKVPEEQSCWRQLNQVLTGERVFDLAGAIELLNEGGTAAEVSMQQDLLNRVRPIIQEIWPSSDAPMQDFSVVLGTAGIEVDVRYQAAKDLGAVPIGMVLQSLQTRLGIPDLTLKAQRIPPAPVPAKKAPGKH